MTPGYEENKSGYLIFNMFHFCPLWKLENVIWASEELIMSSMWTDNEGFIVLPGLLIPGDLPRKLLDQMPYTVSRKKNCRRVESAAEAFSGLRAKGWFGRESHASTPACKLCRKIFQTDWISLQSFHQSHSWVWWCNGLPNRWVVKYTAHLSLSCLFPLLLKC